MKRIVGFDYENGVCVGITVDGILDDNTNPNELVNFERVRYGRWMERQLKKFPEEHIDVCSVCGVKSLAKYNYCHNCGAKMNDVLNQKTVTSDVQMD